MLVGALEAKWNRLAPAAMKTVRDDVTKVRYFESVHMGPALEELRLSGLGSATPQLRRCEIFDGDDDSEICMSLIFHSPEVPFKDWIELARKGRLDSFFQSSCTVTKVSSEERLVSIDLSTAVFVDSDVKPEPAAAEHSHSHSHAHDHAPHSHDEEATPVKAKDVEYSR